MILDAVTFILFCLLCFTFVGYQVPGAPGQAQWRYGYGILGLLTLIAFLAHLFGKFGPNGTLSGG